ncbi:hypothetical protein CA264_19995 [Pontibacter actiniarum]|uniref:Uncharacterized protein n=1 Tax=Pontibacter actiniarum TaxID=323450 RepID=A0A1X9YXP8_9BACT|nr:hypothetical protein CA264_19995 [Pontibacter actiniarum]
MPYSERFLLRSELDEESELPEEDLEEEEPDDFPSFLDEPALALVLDDLEVEPEVLLPLDVLLFGEELDELEADPLMLLPLSLLDLSDVLLDVDDVGFELLDELLDWLLSWLELWFFSLSFIVLISLFIVDVY